MTKLSLTEKSVVALSVPGKDRLIWDIEVTGFGLRVSPQGKAVYVIQYRNASGQTRRMVVGSANVLTLKEARKLARQRLAEVASGADPSAKRKADRAAQTVAELGTYFLEVYAPSRKLSKRYVADCRGLINCTITPRLGSAKIAAITPDNIRRLMYEMGGTPVRANRCLSLLSKMFNLAIEVGARSDNPTFGISKNIETHRDVYMSVAELEGLLRILNEHPDQDQADAVRLLLTTGARIGEVVGARWAEFDIEAGRWTKPPTRTKQKRVHRVGLNTLAHDVLKALHKRAPRNVVTDKLVSPYLFPRRDDLQKPRPEIKKFWRTVQTRAGLGEFRLYDARHTFASHALINGVPLGIVGALLGHASPTTTARYAHVAESVTKTASDVVGNIFKGFWPVAAEKPADD